MGRFKKRLDGYRVTVVSKADTKLPYDIMLDSSGLDEKKNLAPRLAVDVNGDAITVTIERQPKVTNGRKFERLPIISRWIKKYLPVLIAHWAGEITDREALDRLGECFDMNTANPYMPDNSLLETGYKRNYYKYAAVVNVDGASYLIDGSLVKMRGWELAIYELKKRYTDFTFESSQADAFKKNGVVLDFVPRSIFLFPAKSKEALAEAFYLVRDYLTDNSGRAIKSCLEELDENPRLDELCSIAH